MVVIWSIVVARRSKQLESGMGVEKIVCIQSITGVDVGGSEI